MPAGALPVIVTAVAEDGEAGEVTRPVGAAGAVVLFVKSICAEQAEVLPAASVAVALQVLVLLLAAVTDRPGAANCAALPEVTGDPLQVAPL